MPEKRSALGEFHTAQNAAKVAVTPKAQQHPFEKKRLRKSRKLYLALSIPGQRQFPQGLIAIYASDTRESGVAETYIRKRFAAI